MVSACSTLGTVMIMAGTSGTDPVLTLDANISHGGATIAYDARTLNPCTYMSRSIGPTYGT